MCGIVGYVGDKKAASILYGGLKRLEYRGYDSSGIAVNDGLNIDVVKKKGKLEQLKDSIKDNVNGGTTGIGHTRWATHGQPSDTNSHPHSDCGNNFVIAHNGIIENFQNIKKYLKDEGHVFQSETDTEVIAHLLEDYYEEDILKALKKTVNRLEGSYALTILSKYDPDKIYVARKDSPLIIGIGENENYIASDIPAFLGETRDFYILEDGEFAVINKEQIDIYDFNLEPKDKEIYHVDWDPEMAEKQGYDHFMLKEIHEQPDAVRRLMANRVTPEGIELEELNLDKKFIDNLNKVQKSIEMLESMQEKGITLPADKKELLTKVKRASLQLTVEKKKLGKEIKELTDEINNSPAAVVKVKDCIFSGVQILTSHDKKIILNKLLGCKFKEENKEIRQISD